MPDRISHLPSPIYCLITHNQVSIPLAAFACVFDHENAVIFARVKETFSYKYLQGFCILSLIDFENCISCTLPFKSINTGLHALIGVYWYWPSLS
jgi:hypothetical protein